MEIVKFCLWQWRRFDLWQRLLILVPLLTLINVFVPEPYQGWLTLIAGGILLILVISFVIVDGILPSWQRYRQERQQLFDRIKNSDSAR